MAARGAGTGLSVATYHHCRAVPGGRDTLARILADHLRTLLGQPVIIENVSGAGGSAWVEWRAQRLMGTPRASVTGKHMF
jgi:tripartite-type tricarboxylate transporter receptor subunit TctC